MAKPILSIKSISKRYSLSPVGISSFYRQALKLLRTGLQESIEPNDFWALKNVSFDVEPGEIVGLIGRNGAGKSTLLKILSRITEPTSGEIVLRGRVGSLLEVGTGFHPELSGRDNIYLNGAILGMSRAEISRKFDEIVAFSEVEQFLETPVKRYSSGMYVRLAFAVAAHLEPDILIVDEVLAVGDQQFQKKCIGKMRDVSNREGRTVIVVSHTMPVILQLTHRCVVLDRGESTFIGSPEDAVLQYQNDPKSGSAVRFDLEHTPRSVKGTLDATIVSLRYTRKLPIFESGEDFCYTILVRARRTVSQMRVSMTIFAADGTPVGSCFSEGLISLENGEEREVEIILPNPRLAPGAYYCGVAIGKGSHKTGHVDFDIVLETLQFEVCAEPGVETAVSHWCNQWGRIVFTPLSVSTTEPVSAFV